MVALLVGCSVVAVANSNPCACEQSVWVPTTLDDLQSLLIGPLFLVAEASYCDGSEGSAIVVYNEKGEFVETITGFNFAGSEPAPVIDPRRRMGWAFSGPKGFSQLQQFFY